MNDADGFDLEITWLESPVVRSCDSGPAVLLFLLLPLACAEAPDPPAGRDSAPAVRDSAGIEIVENRAPRWTEATAWRLSPEPLFRIPGSDGSQTDLPLDPMSLDVDARGRIIVADGNQVGWDAILVYDSLGTFLFRAGGSGEGPGEFGQLWWASAYRGDSIAGFDMAGDDLAIFDPDGRFSRQVRTPSIPTDPPQRGTYGFTAGMDAVYEDGHFLAYPFGRFEVPPQTGAGWMQHKLLRLAPDGESWDTLGTFPIGQAYWDGTRQQPIRFAPYAVRAVGGDHLYFGTGESFEIRGFDAEGRLERIIRKRHETAPVTDELKGRLLEWLVERVRSSREGGDAAVERVRRSFETGQFADVLPAYSHAFIDDLGHLWVEHFRWIGGVEWSPDPEPARWSVFDTTGVWLGDVETPPGLILREATEDRALGFVVDEFDVKEVQVYGLDRRGS